MLASRDRIKNEQSNKKTILVVVELHDELGEVGQLQQNLN
jgi:hypothetical protein